MITIHDVIRSAARSCPGPARVMFACWAMTALALASDTDTLPAGPAKTIHLETNSPGRVYEGIGGVAGLRLLIDYPEPQRSQILDYLFKPKFGAGFQHYKAEIGGGENSTCGTVPSHAMTREELADPKPRGFELWLMAEARKRNPGIFLDCLPWTMPRWVGANNTKDAADWIVAFLETARKHYGLELNWISAAQNEMGTDYNWIKQHLRPALDARGFQHVKLQTPDDDSSHWEVCKNMQKDTDLARLLSAVGYHYIAGREPWDIDQANGQYPATAIAKECGKPLWASEEWTKGGGHWGDGGALYVARLIHKLHIRDGVTKVEFWSPYDGAYNAECLLYNDTGAMLADTPWSGSYTVWPTVWAIAHTTQFAEPGWVFVDNGCGQFDPGTWRGSHLAYRDPKSGDWSVVVITAKKKQTIRIELGAGLKRGPVHVWKSSEKAQFIRQPSLTLKENAVELELEGDCLYSFTSTTGQQKGSHGTPPEPKAFPFPFEVTFEEYKPGETARYFADQKGSFEVCKSPRGDLCLAQIVPEEGLLWCYMKDLPKPYTVFGDPNWQDYAIEADVLLVGGDVEIGVRYCSRQLLGYRWVLANDGGWKLKWCDKLLAEGRLEKFDPAVWHRLCLEIKGNQLCGFVDGSRVVATEGAIRGTCIKGMAFLASTYHRNLFDNVKVSVLPAR